MNTSSFIRSVETTNIKWLVFSFFLTLLIGVPSFVHSQWITGPMVNAILFTSVLILGPLEALMLGLMPSAVALSSGLLPLPLAPMVPFIMLGNALMVLVFSKFRKQSFFVAVVVAAFLKFAFLHQTVVWLMKRLLSGELVAKLAIMMSWPQFFTALIGGGIAYLAFGAFKKD